MSHSKGEHKDGISQPTFPESTSLTSLCVMILKHAPQAKAPGQVNRPFHKMGVCFGQLSLQYPGGGSLPRAFSLVFQIFGVRKCNPPRPPEPGTQQASPLWVVHVGWLWWGSELVWEQGVQPSGSGRAAGAALGWVLGLYLKQDHCGV